MIENINYLIELVGGKSNALTILALFIGLFFSFYFYFKTFFRLVFTTERIFKTKEEIVDWKNEENIYTTRILFYNNGRKTLTENEIKKLNINCNNEIISIRLLEDIENIKLHQKSSQIEININYLDSSKFFVVEIEHRGHIEVEGRISESGEILRTEPRYWIIINLILIIYFFFGMFYNVIIHLNEKNSNYSSALINLLLLFSLGITMRFIHSLLFIPDSISSKYIGAKDKWNKEFKNQF